MGESVILLGRGLKQKDSATALFSLTRRSVGEHEGIAARLKTLKGSADWTPCVRSVLNQGVSETCWAHSAAQAKFIVDVAKLVAAGTPLADAIAKVVLASPLYFALVLYALYRAAQTPPGVPLPGPGLADQGAQLDDAAAAFGRFGSQPFGEQQQGINTDVPATQDENGDPVLLPELSVPAAESGFAQPFGGSYDVQTGSGAGDRVAAALEAVGPVWFGTSVGQAFQALVAGQVAQPCPASDPTAGGHAMLYAGYEAVPVNGTLTRRYRVLNSWGSDFCEGGYCWASEAFVEANWQIVPFEDQTL